MGKVLDNQDQRFKSLNHSIRDLYLKMALHGLEVRREPVATLSEEALLKRAVFYRKMCGEFAQRFRTARQLTPQYVAELMDWTEEKYLSFEKGESAFTDDQFSLICRLLGAEEEIQVFLANFEEAFNGQSLEKKAPVSSTEIRLINDDTE